MIPASTITINRLLLKLEMELYQRAPGGCELEGEVKQGERFYSVPLVC